MPQRADKFLPRPATSSRFPAEAHGGHDEPANPLAARKLTATRLKLTDATMSDEPSRKVQPPNDKELFPLLANINDVLAQPAEALLLLSAEDARRDVCAHQRHSATYGPSAALSKRWIRQILVVHRAIDNSLKFVTP
jgi:hypothetical protein